ncbi:hypothetical protein M5K25_016510 [Dendrobium thyrsiflorum]|uniref:Uncharacterized protein n=1 Tax=Dendrobium thyrsiflorum TaxID=117978 RepID=A0ABD0US13_DENTH
MDLRLFFLTLVLLLAASGKLCCSAREFHSRISGRDDSVSVIHGRSPLTPPPPRPNQSPRPYLPPRHRQSPLPPPPPPPCAVPPPRMPL